MRTAAIKHFYAVAGFNGVQHITALGVTLSRNFSMAKHIDTVMSSCARTLYGLRTLRAHGMPQAALQLVFRSIALAKLLYAEQSDETVYMAAHLT